MMSLLFWNIILRCLVIGYWSFWDSMLVPSSRDSLTLVRTERSVFLSNLSYQYYSCHNFPSVLKEVVVLGSHVLVSAVNGLHGDCYTFFGSHVLNGKVYSSSNKEPLSQNTVAINL